MLIKQHHILQRNLSDGEVVLFRDRKVPEEGELADSAPQFLMRSADWADMGAPDTITVTIEPGDHLNES